MPTVGLYHYYFVDTGQRGIQQTRLLGLR